MLSAIYIKGFKTFARPVRMPLTEGVTVIVGPNGSGKSNITDAVLFALGEGSPSLLRAGLMGDLIFSGSESLPVAGAAEVTLVLDNSGGTISLPYEEVSLTRRISRDGETEYGINGVRARLSDVRAVAGEAGFGRHSILRQGAVDAIVAGGAAASRTALEEAAGLGVFRRRRLAASRKLEKAAARLERSRQAELELSSQLRRIEAEAVAAREYRELEARYREVSLAHLYSIAKGDLGGERERLKELEEEADKLRERQDALREEEKQLRAEEKELEGRVRVAEEAIRGLEDGSEALRAEALRAERALLRLEASIDGRVERSRLVFRLEAELDETDSKIERLEEEVGRLEEEHSRRKEAFGQLEERVKRARMEHAAGAERRARIAGELRALREQRERAASWLKETAFLGDEELARLREMEDKLTWHAPEEMRARGAAVLERLGELRLLTTRQASEADRRRGMLIALVGRTEAEIRVLKSLGQAAVGGKRLYEILRPRPGYEAAVEAALGDLADGVLAKDLGEGIKLLSRAPAEHTIVRLDAQGITKNGAPPGKPLLDCVEVLDHSYAEALERLLGGAYVVKSAERMAPERGYDVAVTRDGLRFTRTSASRRTRNGDFARQARLVEKEERLDALKNRLGEELYDLRETISSIDDRLDGGTAKVEAFSALASQTARVARLLVSESGRRVRKAKTSREQRLTDEANLRKVEAKISETEDELRGAQEAEQQAKEELDAASRAEESAYAETREAVERLVQTRTALQSDRERRVQISRSLNDLKGKEIADSNSRRVSLTHRTVKCGRCLEETARGRLARLRSSRSDAVGLQGHATEKRARLTGETGDVAGELARVTSEAVALRAELSHAEEAAKSAEVEIYEEWGATLEIARRASETSLENTERERTRLARRLKNYGDVNLLAISQEGQLRERYEFVASQRSDAEAAAAEIEHIIRNVDEEIEARFEATFEKARRAFEDMVPRMMEGAAGKLSLSEEGVEIGLRLRGRGWRPMRVLSGGERSLLALSFLFSIFLSRFDDGSGPFCMLDEAEAALDDVNLARFLAVVDSYRPHGQFLLVTHQKRTMAAADVLYGVTQDASGATVVVSKRLSGE